MNYATTQLKNSKDNLMVFLNRYDGLDLAGDMCRILVLDGKPMVFKYLGQRIREEMSKLILTQEQLAEAAEVNESYIGQVELERRIPA